MKVFLAVLNLIIGLSLAGPGLGLYYINPEQVNGSFIFLGFLMTLTGTYMIIDAIK